MVVCVLHSVLLLHISLQLLRAEFLFFFLLVLLLQHKRFFLVSLFFTVILQPYGSWTCYSGGRQ